MVENKRKFFGYFLHTPSLKIARQWQDNGMKCILVNHLFKNKWKKEKKNN